MLFQSSSVVNPADTLAIFFPRFYSQNMDSRSLQRFFGANYGSTTLATQIFLSTEIAKIIYDSHNHFI